MKVTNGEQSRPAWQQSNDSPFPPQKGLHSISKESLSCKEGVVNRVRATLAFWAQITKK